MSELYHVSSSPHVRAKDTTSRIMLYVIIVLLPTSIFGIVNFGYKAAVLLLALNLPASLPWWEAVIGGVFAIVIVKMMFGGLGQNFMNPALGARCFLLIAFAADMTNFTVDGYSGATPLALIREQGVGAVNTMNMLIGKTAGTIGETSAIAILIGAMFLILMGVITLRIPGTYIITFVIFISLFGGHGFDIDYIVAELCGGGLMLGLWSKRRRCILCNYFKQPSGSND